MTWLASQPRLVAVHLGLCALVLLWDLYIAGRTAQLRATPRPMALLSALAGLLLVPALVVFLVSNSMLSGRALFSIAWVWPVTVALVAAQAVYALFRRLAAPPIAISIAVFDLLLAVTYAARYAMFIGHPVPAPLVALVAAQRGALAFSAQPLALRTPWLVYVPIFAPATPGRRGGGTLLRTAVATIAAAWAALAVVDVPGATRAVRSYGRYAGERLQERPDSDFAIGVKIFPTLRKGPPPLSIQSDLALADTVGAEVLSVYVTPAGATPATLDSIAHTLDDARGDRRLVVALDLSAERPVPAARRARYLGARAADVERIVRRLRPDYVVPVLDPTGAAERAIGAVGARGWIAYLSEAAAAAHRARPVTRVMVHLGGFGPRDSTLYAWAVSPSAPVQAVGLSLFPWLGGANALDARMRAADAWLRAYRSDREHWVLETGGFPLAHGEASQARAIWGTLAWATSRAAVKGVIAYDAGDYEAPEGLRAPGGRLRPAAALLRAAVLSLGE
ncbi:MAG TPA: hypothetical protein VF041_13080 [Gemmatimonadaceae bacterium]